ncbi:MAG: hypothetical protein QW767_06015 [Thermoprotei archaeon]
MTVTDLRQVVERAGLKLTGSEVYRIVTSATERGDHLQAFIKLDTTLRQQAKLMSRETGIKETYTYTKVRVQLMDEAVSFLKKMASGRRASRGSKASKKSLLSLILQ